MTVNTTVLLLETHDDCRAVYAEAMRQAGFDVTAFSDAQIALEMAPNVRPRVIVASFDTLTRDERLHFCEQLKRDRRTKRVPVLLTSTKVDEEDLRLATTAGALALNLSPHDATKLVAAIQGVLAAQPKPLSASLRRAAHRSRSA